MSSLTPSSVPSGAEPPPDPGHRADDGRPPLGISLATGTALLVPLLFADHFVRVAPWRFAVPALAVATFAVLTDDVVASAGFVLVTALLVDGFLVGSGGTLSWDGRPDAARLLVLLLAGAAGLGLRSVVDAFRPHPADSVPPGRADR